MLSFPIYLSPPDVSDVDREALLQAFDGNWIAPVGPDLKRFEQCVCEYAGVKAALALTSGTAALHLALQLAGVRAGDFVICSSLTFVGSTNPIRYLGAEPVFIDSEEESWNMDPILLEAALADLKSKGKPAAAIIAVDLYGQCAQMEPILRVAESYGVPVIEDAAEALGASYRSKKAGSMGKWGFYSFNGNKILSTSGGGMLLSDDEDSIEEARFLATQARDPAPHYQHTQVGYNYRLSNLLAALGCGQMTALDEKVNKRRLIFDRYVDALGALPGVAFMPEPEWSRSTRWLTCATMDAGQRDHVIHALQEKQIEARPVWKPMHLQPLYQDCNMYGGCVAEKLFTHGICLPSGSSMSDEAQAYVCDAIKSCF